MSEESLVHYEQDGPITVGLIKATSVLDAANVDRFGNDVMQYVKKHPNANLLLDFQHVDYLSSAVLTELIRIHNILEERKGQLRLCDLNRDIRKVFEITNLDKMFVIYDADAAQSVKRFKRSLDIAAEDDAWSSLQKEP